MLKSNIFLGMLPAVELDGRVITESDDILYALEDQFGPLFKSMDEVRICLSKRFFITPILV